MATTSFNYRILIVDDDAVFCEIAENILPSHGFEVRFAADGFEALNILKSALPDLIIADLNMPRMSGFELLSIVRRRFPQLPVVAMSGEFTGPEVPAGVLADLFLEKGRYRPTELVRRISELLERAPLRPSPAKSQYAPLWIPINERGYYVVTCTNCMRSFPLPEHGSIPDRSEHTAECEHCGTVVRYHFDVSLRETARSRANVEPFAR